MLQLRALTSATSRLPFNTFLTHRGLCPSASLSGGLHRNSTNSRKPFNNTLLPIFRANTRPFSTTPPKEGPVVDVTPSDIVAEPTVDVTNTVASSSTASSASPSTTNIRTSDSAVPQRSRTHLVETIHGRSRRWFYDPKTGRLSFQWMWSDDEEEFDMMIKRSQTSSISLTKLRSLVRNAYSRMRAVFHSTLLPAGFPDSVHSCYVSFSTWQFLETLANSVAHVLCSQAMLSSVGLPTSPEAVAGGAVAIRWIVKDGLAHFAKLAFTKKYAYAFDFRPKTWGVLGEAMLIAGSTFELSTALAASYGFPYLFIPLAAIGASMQSVAHLAWEATHANFVRWLSLRNNIADITAKADSQMVVSELLGLGVGVAFITHWHQPWHLFACFAVCAPIHLVCTLGRLRSVRFGMLSESRALQLFNAYVRHHAGFLPLPTGVLPEDVVAATGAALPASLVAERDMAALQQHVMATIRSAQTHSPAAATATGVPLSITAMEGKESEPRVPQVLALASPDQCHVTDKMFGEWFAPKQWESVYGYCPLKIGVTVSEAFATEEQLLGAVSLYKDELYLVNYRADTNTVYVVYEEDCDDDTVLMSLLQATKLAYDLRKAKLAGASYFSPVLQSVSANSPTVPSTAAGTASAASATATDILRTWDPRGLMRESFQWTKRHFDQTKALLEDAGWDTEVVVWGDVGNRVYWELPAGRPVSPTSVAPTVSGQSIGVGIGTEEIPAPAPISAIKPSVSTKE